MRAKVIKLYRDKNSKRYRMPGELISMPEERFEEINSTSLGIFLEQSESLDEEQKEVVLEESIENTSEEITEEVSDGKPEEKKTTSRRTKK
ncbi:MAG: hypothetical protein IBX70_13450 [Clostridia bacterium]|nr:hypothetical protein [Clostridia bacterium]